MPLVKHGTGDGEVIGPDQDEVKKVAEKTTWTENDAAALEQENRDADGD